MIAIAVRLRRKTPKLDALLSDIAAAELQPKILPTCLVLPNDGIKYRATRDAVQSSVKRYGFALPVRLAIQSETNRAGLATHRYPQIP